MCVIRTFLTNVVHLIKGCLISIHASARCWLPKFILRILEFQIVKDDNNIMIFPNQTLFYLHTAHAPLEPALDLKLLSIINRGF